MKHLSLLVVGAMAVLLASCHKGDEASEIGEAQRSHGQYAGVGVYVAEPGWGKMQGAPQPQDPQIAKITDDEHVIVVVDTHSGEIRQCGDHSGYCVAISPWAAGQKVAVMPAKLEAHAPYDAASGEPGDGATKGK